MAKKEIDYSKVKAMAQSILECIGDDQDIGENPDIKKEKPTPGSFDDVGTSEKGQMGFESQGDQEPILNFIGDELADGKNEEEPDSGDDSYEGSDSGDRGATKGSPGIKGENKKRKDSALALMGSVLASKFNGRGNQA